MNKSLENTFENEGRIKVLDPKKYGVNLGGYPIAESGSSVYQGEMAGKKYCYKVYKIVPLAHHELKTYKNIVETLRKSDPKSLGLVNKEGARVVFNIRFIPIDEIGVVPNKQRASSVSEFIEGPTLKDFLDFQTGREQKDYVKRNVRSSPVFDLLENISEEEIEQALSEMSQELNEKAGTSGISIVPVNVKPDFVNNIPTFIITDLYAQLKKLQEDTMKLDIHS